MTKKEFKTKISVHVYGRQRESKLIAIFFDWLVDGVHCGYKYCVYARAMLATQKDLENAIYKLAILNEDVPEYYIQTIIAPDDTKRFKVPLTSSGLYPTKLYKL